MDDTLRGTAELGLGGLTRKLHSLRRRLRGAPPEPVKPSTGRLRLVTGGAKAALTTRGRSALARMVAGSSDDDLHRRFDSPVAQRALFTAMAQGFQPRMAHGFTGAMAIGLRGRRAGPDAPTWWTITIDGKRASTRQGRADDAAVVIETDAATFLRLFSGDLNPLTAWLSGLVDIDGDVTLGPRLVELFGGVKPFDLGQAG
jgi:hypothetical protein